MHGFRVKQRRCLRVPNRANYNTCEINEIIHFEHSVRNFCRMILLIVDLQNLLPFEGSGEEEEGSAGGRPDIVDHPQNEGLSRGNR